MNDSMTYARCGSPLGDLLLLANGDALCGVYFAGQKHFPALASAWRESDEVAALRAGLEQLREYFSGSRTTFALPLAPRGTAFQRAVWNAIAAVPHGATATYAAIAAAAGHAGSARAAGAATGRNPLSIVIPCHRIVASNGALTGYAGGLARKRALLALERAGRDLLAA